MAYDTCPDCGDTRNGCIVIDGSTGEIACDLDCGFKVDAFTLVKERAAHRTKLLMARAVSHTWLRKLQAIAWDEGVKAERNWVGELRSGDAMNPYRTG